MIKRHNNINRNIESELEITRIRYEKNTRKLIKRITNNEPVNLDAYKITPMELATFCLSSLEFDVKKVKTYLNNYLELGVRHFQREFSQQEYILIQLDGVEYKISNKKKRGKTNSFYWWELFNSCLILREKKFLGELYELLEDSISLSKDPFWKRSIDLLLMCVGRKVFEPSILSDITSISNSGVVVYHGLAGSRLVKLSNK